MQKVNILGTEYTIVCHKISEDKFMEKNGFEGYCGQDAHIIVYADFKEKKYFGDLTKEERKARKKYTLRHELLHAFLNESGLAQCSNPSAGGWARNEEMVDWMAIQFPKIHEIFKELGIEEV